MSKPRIGFIGLGIMGKPMSINLLRAGYALSVYDESPGAMEAVVAAGAAPTGSVRECAADADVLITMLPDSPQVEAVLLGPEGAIACGRAGMIIVDMSSIAPASSIRCEHAARQAGMRLIDAPVSGGEPNAISGKLAIMCGGDAEAMEAVRPILSHLGSKITHMGPVGAGNTTKLCNQIIVAGNIIALSEALALAKESGLSQDAVFQAIRGGLAGSSVMEAKAPMIEAMRFEPGFRIALHWKDLHNAKHAAQENDMKTPIVDLALEMMASLMAGGHGNLDHSGLYLAYERLREAPRPEAPTA